MTSSSSPATPRFGLAHASKISFPAPGKQSMAGQQRHLKAAATLPAIDEAFTLIARTASSRLSLGRDADGRTVVERRETTRRQPSIALGPRRDRSRAEVNARRAAFAGQ